MASSLVNCAFVLIVILSQNNLISAQSAKNGSKVNHFFLPPLDHPVLETYFSDIEKYVETFVKTEHANITLFEIIGTLKANLQQKEATMSDITNALLGIKTKRGEITTYGIYTEFIQMYNAKVFWDTEVKPLKTIGRLIFNAENQVRQYQHESQLIHRVQNLCWPLITAKYRVWNTTTNGRSFARNLYDSIELDKQLAIDCDPNGADVRHARHQAVNVVNNTIVAFMHALYVYTATVDVAFLLSDYWNLPGISHELSTSGGQLGIFEKMMVDIEADCIGIEKNLAIIKQNVFNPNFSEKDKKYWNKTWNHLNEAIENLVDVFHEQDEDKELYSRSLMEYRKEALQEIRQSSQLAALHHYARAYETIFRKNFTEFKEKVYNDGLDVGMWSNIATLYSTKLRSAGTFRNFDPNNPATTYIYGHPPHDLRVDWELLDGMHELTKCYLGKTYWFHLRNDTIKKSQQPLTRIFNYVSHTLFEFCDKTDTDIIGQCTAANHEICMPLHLSDEMQNQVDSFQDLTMLRPKWVSEPILDDQNERACHTQLTFIPPLNACRCGFRLDCGDPSIRNITCSLQLNDRGRKQCRGSIAYPCKSHPLAPYAHDNTCKTDYCDMESDSCENDPNVYPLVYSGAKHRPGEI